MKKYIALLGCTLLLSSCSSMHSASKQARANISQQYVQERSAFTTKLIRKAKSPQGYTELQSTDTMKVVSYPSGDYQLKGLLETSNIKKGKKSPVLVYLHGGFALGASDITDTKPFLDKGFVVFAPSYRGENGNDGNFEMLMGEVDDAKSAVEWIAKQPFTDTDNIYVFGHSIGGGLSLHLSFFSDLPIKQVGSSAGLYNKQTLISWEAPFDTSNKEEFIFRLPLYNLDKMARKHVMYIGSDDGYVSDLIITKIIYSNKKILLDLQEVKGDHFSSLSVAMNKFIQDYYKP